MVVIISMNFVVHRSPIMHHGQGSKTTSRWCQSVAVDYSNQESTKNAPLVWMSSSGIIRHGPQPTGRNCGCKGGRYEAVRPF